MTRLQGVKFLENIVSVLQDIGIEQYRQKADQIIWLVDQETKIEVLHEGRHTIHDHFVLVAEVHFSRYSAEPSIPRITTGEFVPHDLGKGWQTKMLREWAGFPKRVSYRAPHNLYLKRDTDDYDRNLRTELTCSWRELPDFAEWTVKTVQALAFDKDIQDFSTPHPFEDGYKEKAFKNPYLWTELAHKEYEPRRQWFEEQRRRKEGAKV